MTTHKTASQGQNSGTEFGDRIPISQLRRALGWPPPEQPPALSTTRASPVVPLSRVAGATPSA